MLYTSAQANKLLLKLNKEHELLRQQESEASAYVAATIEKPEDARPPYDYAQTQKQLARIEQAIVTIKHAINVFNTTHKIPGFDLTADQALAYLPLLRERGYRLARMANRMPKTRIVGGNSRSGLIEYEYANYDVEEAKREYFDAMDKVAKLKLALEQLNNTETMEIAIEA